MGKLRCVCKICLCRDLKEERGTRGILGLLQKGTACSEVVGTKHLALSTDIRRNREVSPCVNHAGCQVSQVWE